VEITIRDNTFVYRGTVFPPNRPVADEYAKLAQMNRDRTFGMVCRYTKAMAGYTFAHEVGHLLGCHHALGDSAKKSSTLRAEYAEVTFSPYGREETGTYTGFTLGTGNSVRDEFLAMGNHFLAAGNGTAMGRYATIMATAVPGVITRIPRFANPGVHWRGRSTGDNHGRYLPPPLDRRRPMYYDQVRAIKLIGPIVARYRDQTGTFRHDEKLRGGWNSTDPAGGDMAAADSPGFPTGVPDSVVVPGTRTQPARGGLADSSGGGAASRRTGSGARPASSVAGGTSRPRKGISASTRPSANPPGTLNPVTSTTPPVTVVKPNPGGVGARPPGPPNGGGNPGAPVRNDTRRRSQPMVVRVLADRSYLATVNGHNLGATGSGDAAMRTDDARPVFHGRSVWWHLVVPADGDYELQADTRGSAIDTTLAVWLPGAARPLANDNDPRRPDPASAVRVRRRTLGRGQKIELVVDGVDGAQGQVQLNVRLKPIRR
jgi:hypothetical protein